MSGHAVTVLIVDSNEQALSVARTALQREGFVVETATDAAELASRLPRTTLVVIDMNIPTIPWHSLHHDPGPARGILFIASTPADAESVVALEADDRDYVRRPYTHRELVARIHSLLRRVTGRPAPYTRAMFGDFTMNLDNRTLNRDGQSIELTRSEFDLLAILVEEPHRAISREEIARRVLGREWNPDDRGVDVLVSKLRGKLSNLNGPEIIRSLRGVGYQFVAGLQFE